MPTAHPHTAFTTGKAYVRTLKLRTRDDWRKHVRPGTKTRLDLDTRAIPCRPDFVYRKQGWRGWNDWLGSNRFVGKSFMSYSDWLDWVRKQGFRSRQEYSDWCKKNASENDDVGERERLRVPSSPEYVYKDFPGWRAVLTEHNIMRRGQTPRNYSPFRLARRWARSIARSHNLKTANDWRLWARDHRAELAANRCPATPDRVAEYRADFRGWADFLGVNTHPAQNRKR